LIDLLTKHDDDPAPAPAASTAPPAATTPPADAGSDAPPPVCAADAGACDGGFACCNATCSEDFVCEACRDAGAVCNYFQGGGCCLGLVCEPAGDNGNGDCKSCRRSGDPIPTIGGTHLVRVCCSKEADSTGARCK
jgi:hypothetical protein